MLVDEQFRKCVAFLFADQPNEETNQIERRPAATAFFVQIDIGNGRAVPYVVTAQHVIHSSRRFGPLYVRLNLQDGTAGDLPIAPDDWVLNPTTDVAVARMLVVEGADLLDLPLSMFATPEYVQAHGVGVGDEVFFTGLFSQHPGMKRSLPIIRFGTIALMPHEKVLTRIDPATSPREVDAYLIEARSWGGHSGSPAFVFYPPDRTPGTLTIGSAGPALLGLVSGHFDIPRKVEFLGDIPASGNVGMNAGIAVVIPAQAILDTLMEKDLVEERKELAKTPNEQQVVTPDSAQEH